MKANKHTGTTIIKLFLIPALFFTMQQLDGKCISDFIGAKRTQTPCPPCTVGCGQQAIRWQSGNCASPVNVAPDDCYHACDAPTVPKNDIFTAFTPEARPNGRCACVQSGDDVVQPVQIVEPKLIDCNNNTGCE